MTLERITESNLNYAVQIQEELFPGESARTNYEESFAEPSAYEYYLIYEDGACAGIIGLYCYPEDPDSAWLGWFGIREGFRRKRLGSRALKQFEEMAAARGYRFARLYTDAVNNDAAIAFYKSNDYTCEPYLNPQDPACIHYPTVIFSKTLAAGALAPWNNRSIHLTEQIAKQNKKKFALPKAERNHTMELYTELEQAILDPSLVIITDRITTRSELSRAIVRYRALPKIQRRFSNYYSTIFLGHNVPEMYVLMRDKLEADRDLFANLQLPNETFVVSEPDLYYKEDSFNSGDTNICFILGHSGSGKSIMARALVGDDIDHIELDDLLLIKDHFTMEELKDYSDLFYSFFTGAGAKYYIGIEERDRIPKEEYEDRVFLDFVSFAMAYAERHREKKYIIEGIWIYLYFDDPSMFEPYAVFIKGTSFLKSKIRAMKREMQRDREALQDRKEMFGREVRNYLLDEEKIDRYRSYFSDRPETIFREETSNAEKQDQFVLGEWRRVDQCFVTGDADGIRAIKKDAEENKELSGWNKLRIINECTAALVELRLSGQES